MGNDSRSRYTRAIRTFLATLPTTLLLLTTGQSAVAATGDRLDLFTPSTTGNGRGIEVPGTASTTAYYSTTSSEDRLYVVDLKTHAQGTTLDTNLETLETGRTYGALAWDAVNGRLLGARYRASTAVVDAINVSTGGVSQLFDASATASASLTGVDGLSVDSDGTIWIKADGLSQTTTTVYHLTATGSVISSFVVSFGNSGLVVDGDNLWLVDVNNRIVYQYTKTGTATGVSFSTTGLDEPEDATIDNCTFSGKKALWIYTAAFASSSMAAYEIGSSQNTGCPSSSSPTTTTPTTTTTTPATTTTPTTSPVVTDPGGPSKIQPKKPKGGYVSGTPIRFSVPSSLDPNGTLFTYLWYWSDYTGFTLTGKLKKPKKRGAEKASAATDHKYQCAGKYKGIKVDVLDSFGNKKTITLKKTISVAFPKSTTKRYSALRVRPKVKGKGNVATLGIAVTNASASQARFALVEPSSWDAWLAKKTGRKARVTGSAYYVDGTFVGRRKSARATVNKKVSKGPHRLKIRVSFKRPKGRKTINTCFQIR